MSFKLSDKCFIIAEAGTCHASSDVNERFELAMDYVYTAAECRVDAIKFQMFLNPTPENMFCWIDGDEERSKRWKQSVLHLWQWNKVKDEAEALGLLFLSSAFEDETVEWQTRLNVPATKVASRAAGYLEHFKDAPKPLLVSNGMTKVEPYIDPIGFYEKTDEQIVLQCEANYPSTTRWDSQYSGFSDHSGDPWRAIDAIARGCKLIEVHFYIDPLHAGPDYPASLTVDELKLVCEARDSLGSL